MFTCCAPLLVRIPEEISQAEPCAGSYRTQWPSPAPAPGERRGRRICPWSAVIMPSALVPTAKKTHVFAPTQVMDGTVSEGVHSSWVQHAFHSRHLWLNAGRPSSVLTRRRLPYGADREAQCRSIGNFFGTPGQRQARAWRRWETNSEP